MEANFTNFSLKIRKWYHTCINIHLWKKTLLRTIAALYYSHSWIALYWMTHKKWSKHSKRKNKPKIYRRFFKCHISFRTPSTVQFRVILRDFNNTRCCTKQLKIFSCLIFERPTPTILLIASSFGPSLLLSSISRRSSCLERKQD